ncbi:MFS transporter [Paenibacillus amylolyticus]|uniref:MFS transporter n=1 Tax=Paenibacillus amylolyticus TaxID=1451 RepID=UPI003390D2DC
MIPTIIRWRLVAEVCQNTLFYSLFPFIVLYLNAAWGEAISSVALASISIIGVAAGIWGGVLSDRIGRRPLILASGAGFLLSVILYLVGRYVESNILVYIAFGIMSISYSSYIPAGRAYVADWLDENKQKRVYTLSYQAFNVAVILGPLIGSFVYEKMTLWFACIAIGGTLLTLIIGQWATPEFKGDDKSEKAERTGYFQAMTVVWKDRRLLFFVIGSVLAGQAFMQLEILLPAKLFHDLTNQVTFLGYTLSASQYYASLLMANGVLVVGLGSLGVYMSSKYSARFGFVGSSLLYALSMVIFGFSNSYMMYAMGIIVLTAAELLIVSIQDAYIANIAPPEKKGQYFAGASIRYSLSRIIAPQILALVPLAGYTGSFLIAGLLSVLSALAFLKLFKHSKAHHSSLKEAM